MFIVKYNFLSFLKIPISSRLLGKNKTWRGLIFLPIVNSIILGVVNYFLNLNILNPFTLGLILGMAYILFEFPNSLVKRKLGIKPGENHIQYKLIFQLFDKMDSAFGVCLVYYLLGFVQFHIALLLFVMSSLTHIIISKLLLTFKLKKNF